MKKYICILCGFILCIACQSHSMQHIPQYRISSKGMNFIKTHEQLRLTKYKNPGESKYTIGWGHVVDKHERIPFKISVSVANQLFKKDINEVNESINRLLGALDNRFRFSQQFIDGLGSLIYNCGEYNIKVSPFYRTLTRCRYDKHTSNRINKRDYEYALSKIKRTHIYLNGHHTRRHHEYTLMSNKNAKRK